MTDRAASDALHDNLSVLVNATAVFPPRNENEGLDLLDIVVVRPDGGKDRMLVDTGANLGDVLSDEDRAKVLGDVKVREPATKPKSFLTAGLWSATISTAAHAMVENLSVSAGLDGKQITDVLITGEASETLRGNVSMVLENAVVAKFANLVANTGLRNHVQKRFTFGVITGVVTGELAAASAASHGGHSITDSNIVGAGARVQVDATAGNLIQLHSRGIIGVKMSCFAVKVDGPARTYQLSAPIPVIRADEKFFNAARVFVRGGGSPRNVIKVHRVKKNLFRGTVITSPDDLSLDEDTRQAYETVLGIRGGHIDTSLSADGVGDAESLTHHFGLSDGKSLWNANGLSKEPEKGEHKPIFMVTDLESLGDAICEDEMRWLPVTPLPSTVDIVENASD
jgi:hypothetical protein